MLIDKKITKIILILIGSIISVCVNSQVNSPQKPIKFVVITAAGGGGDQSARIVADQLAIKLNRTIIVENNQELAEILLLSLWRSLHQTD